MDSAPAVRALFAKRLKELRAQRGYSTARKLANALGIDENRYTRYERAEVEPSLSVFVRVCETLGVTPNDLLAPALRNVPSGLAAPEQRELGTPIMAPEPVSNRGGNAAAYRAQAWALAREVAAARADRSSHDRAADALSQLQSVSRIFSQIEADPFDFVARLVTLPEVASLDREGRERLASSIEQLMRQLEGERAGRE